MSVETGWKPGSMNNTTNQRCVPTKKEEKILTKRIHYDKLEVHQIERMIMSQTPEGALKARQTILTKYGADFYAKAGSVGGKVKNPLKGFGTHRDLAVSSGQKGGRISRRKAK